MSSVNVERHDRAVVIAYARRLGVHAARPNAKICFYIDDIDEDRLIVCTRGKSIVVDIPTALLILAGHALGVELDVGPCLECEARGEGYEWRWSLTSGDLDRREREGWMWSGGRAWLPSGVRAWPMYRPCPACSVDGKPTGRDVRSWAQAVLDAMPGAHCHACDGKGCAHDDGTPSRGPWVNWADGGREWMCPAYGDPTARAALTAWSGADDLDRYETLGWADSVEETLAVWHDDHLARGGEPWQVPDGDGGLRWTPAAPRGLAEHPDVARTVAAWLSGGRCGRCKGRGWVPNTWDDGFPPGAKFECGACNGHGTAAGARVPLLLGVLERVAPKIRVSAREAVQRSWGEAGTLSERVAATRAQQGGGRTTNARPLGDDT